jgi:transposase
MFTESSDEEQIIERVAALDIGKAEIVCCIRLPAADGERRVQEVSTHSTMVGSLCELANRLVGLGVERVVMEATSDYWRPPFYLFEAHGLDPWLVNAKDVKHLPGRPKTDRLDAVWLCKVAERQMLRPSFVPPGDIRRLRDLTRYRIDLVGVRTAEKNRVDKLLEDACLKLSVVASDIFGVSGRAMMASLIAGERDPKALAELARSRMRTKIPRLEEAFAGLRLGTFDDHHRFLLARMLARVDAVDLDIAAVDTQIGQHLAPFADAAARLDEIPGIGPTAAAIIIAEIGIDMTRFPTPAHLASWAKFAPRHQLLRRQDQRQRLDRAREPLPRPGAGRGRGRGGPDRHLPRCPLPTHRPPTRQEEGHCRGWPLTAGDHLAPPRRPRHPLPRTRRRPLRPTRQHPRQETQPRPPTRSTRLPRHPRTRRLRPTQAPTWSGPFSD